MSSTTLLRTITNFNDSRLLRYWNLDNTELDAFSHELTNTSIIDNLKTMFIDKSDYIISAKMYPFRVGKIYKFASWDNGTQSPVKDYIILGNQTMTSKGAEIAFSNLTNNSQMIDANTVGEGLVKLATFNISRYFNNFMDFAPYTKIKIYIPFMGFYDLDVNEVMGQSIEVYYGVDLSDGMATAFICKVVNTTPVFLQAMSGKIGIDIPIGRTNASEIARNNLSNTIKFGAGLVSLGAGMMSGNALLSAGAIVGGTKLITSSAIDTINANTPKYSKGTTPSGFMNLKSPTSVYLIIERPKPLLTSVDDISAFRHAYGSPLEQVKTLSTLTGFTKVGEIHFTPNGEDIFDDEIEEIVSLLHGGVIL